MGASGSGCFCGRRGPGTKRTLFRILNTCSGADDPLKASSEGEAVPSAAAVSVPGTKAETALASEAVEAEAADLVSSVPDAKGAAPAAVEAEAARSAAAVSTKAAGLVASVPEAKGAAPAAVPFSSSAEAAIGEEAPAVASALEAAELRREGRAGHATA